MSITFVGASAGYVPPNAFEGGKDRSGEPLYVGRAMHQGSKIPGKLHPSHGVVYVSWGGKEHAKKEYEVLVEEGGVDNLQWVSANADGSSPSGALESGYEADKSPLYVGRAKVGNQWTVGKVSPKYKACYVPYGGKEHEKGDFQVLCIITPTQSAHHTNAMNQLTERPQTKNIGSRAGSTPTYQAPPAYTTSYTNQKNPYVGLPAQTQYKPSAGGPGPIQHSLYPSLPPSAPPYTPENTAPPMYHTSQYPGAAPKAQPNSYTAGGFIPHPPNPYQPTGQPSQQNYGYSPIGNLPANYPQQAEYPQKDYPPQGAPAYGPGGYPS